MTGQSDCEYLTIDEAARLYQFSARTITRWVEEGRIPCVLTGKHALIARRALESVFARPEVPDPETTETDP